MLALKPGKGACPKPAAAKAWKVVANYEFFYRDLNTNYITSKIYYICVISEQLTCFDILKIHLI